MSTSVILDKLSRNDKKRIWELDFLRGLSILLMVMDHIFNDIAYLFDTAWYDSANAGAIAAVDAAVFYNEGITVPTQYMWLSDAAIFVLFAILALAAFFSYRRRKEDLGRFIGVVIVSALIMCVILLADSVFGYGNASSYGLRDWVHNFVLWVFFALCGISCFFSHNNVLRTVQIALCAGAISLATFLAEKIGITGVLVRYGVLHMLATSVAVFTVLQLIVNAVIKDREGRKFLLAGLCFAVGAAAFILDKYLSNTLVADNDSLAFLHNAFASRGYRSSDYFPLLSSLPMVMFGCALAPFLYPEKKTMLPSLDRDFAKPVCFFGRHTLFVVLTHQLIITGVLALVSFLFITPGSTGL